MALFKIKDLENITGIKAHTIRIWEKRYGVLTPDRSDSKIRMYSEADLKKLMRLNILYENNWKISKIAKLREDEISKEIERLIELDSESGAVISILIEGILSFDKHLIISTLDNCIKKEGLVGVYFHYFLPVLEKIGLLWLAKIVDPSHEHFFSAIIRDVIVFETRLLPVPATRQIDFVLFCPENQWHELGLLFYNYVLVKKGFNTLYLGQNLPDYSALFAAEQVQPARGVVFYLIGNSSLEETKSIIQRFTEAIEDVNLYVGGQSVDGIKTFENNRVVRAEVLIEKML